MRGDDLEDVEEERNKQAEQAELRSPFQNVGIACLLYSRLQGDLRLLGNARNVGASLLLQPRRGGAVAETSNTGPVGHGRHEMEEGA